MASSSFGSTKANKPYTTTSGKKPVGINKIMKITRRIVASIPVNLDKPPITPANLRLDLERANCFFIQNTSFSSYALSFLTFFSASFFMRGEWYVFAQWMMFDFNTTFIPFERELKTGGWVLDQMLSAFLSSAFLIKTEPVFVSAKR